MAAASGAMSTQTSLFAQPPPPPTTIAAAITITTTMTVTKESFDDHLTRAEYGDSDAQAVIAKCYRYGEGTDKDEKLAMKWMIAAANQGSAAHQNELGSWYWNGYFCGTRDYDEALHWYRLSATQGHSEAMNNVGYAYSSGKGVEMDKKAALEWYMKAAELHHPRAECNIGILYWNGDGVEQSYVKAFEWFLRSAEHGSDKAQYELAECYRLGKGADKDEKLAMKWITTAANQGSATYQYNLGDWYWTGTCCTIDYDQAMKWYGLAAEQNHGDAMYSIGCCYFDGVRIKQDKKAALEWFMKAASLNHPGSMRYIAGYYEEGYADIERSSIRAHEWLIRGSELGDSDCQFSAALYYCCVDVIDVNYEASIHWFHRAALSDRVGEQELPPTPDDMNNDEKRIKWFATVARIYSSQSQCEQMAQILHQQLNTITTDDNNDSSRIMNEHRYWTQLKQAFGKGFRSL